MLLNPIKQVNLKCSPKQRCVRNNKQTVCKQTGGTFKPVDKHLTQKPPQIYKCCYNCLFQICSIPKWWNYIYSIACEKKKMLVAVHTSTINTVQREPEILTNSEKIKGFVCWMYQCLIKFLTKVHVYCLSEFSINHKALNKRY